MLESPDDHVMVGESCNRDGNEDTNHDRMVVREVMKIVVLMSKVWVSVEEFGGWRVIAEDGQ
jgi:hypothetical protein